MPRHPTLEMYDARGMVYMNRRMDVALDKKGVWKKKFEFPKDWDKKTTSDTSNFNGYAVITGKTSNITVIDIDDPELEHNAGLMMLMDEGCNMVAKTKKGFHYVFKYEESIKGKSNNELALDTRNDNNCIFCEPTRDVKNSDGDVVACYEWIRTPLDEEELCVMSPQILQYLRELDAGFFKEAPKVEVEEEVEEVQEAEVSTTTSEPKEIGDEILVQIANALPVKLLDNRSDWITIGLIFFNENLTLEQFKEVSKRSAKYDEAGCVNAWNSFKRDNAGRKITGASLWKMLKEHNKDKFYELMECREDFWTLIEILNHNDTSKYFYNNNPDAYVWNEALGWYSLTRNNIWKSCDKGTPSGLKRHIADTLQMFAKESWNAFNMKHAKALAKENDDAKRKDMEVKKNKKYALYTLAYKSFGSNDFCNSVIAMLPSLYENDTLEEVMDMNRDVIAFTNGLYDLKTSSFRCIMPQDFVSTTTGYEMPRNRNAEAREQIMAMFWSMFENNELIDYILKVFGTCLYGKNRFEEFYVLTGSGRNGKGVLSDFLKYVFGDYFTSVDNSLITKPQERRDQPNPALVDARPKRIMMTTEPEGDDKLQTGIIKKISGGDAVEARTLNSKHIYNYVPPYKLFVQANNIPKLSRVDSATQNRMRVIKFPFKFVPNPIESFHRAVNPDLKEKSIKSIEWRNEFMFMLIDKFNEVKDLKSLSPPKAVCDSTNEYFDDNNPLKNWLDKFYTITKDAKDYVLSSELKRQYMIDMNIEKMGDSAFKTLLEFNNITRERKTAGYCYTGIKRKDIEFEE